MFLAKVKTINKLDMTVAKSGNKWPTHLKKWGKSTLSYSRTALFILVIQHLQFNIHVIQLFSQCLYICNSQVVQCVCLCECFNVWIFVCLNCNINMYVIYCVL